jgi:hypothetical protein
MQEHADDVPVRVLDEQVKGQCPVLRPGREDG